jgi:hypothetical protein
MRTGLATLPPVNSPSVGIVIMAARAVAHILKAAGIDWHGFAAW